jgi:hypothetical protein
VPPFNSRGLQKLAQKLENIVKKSWENKRSRWHNSIICGLGHDSGLEMLRSRDLSGSPSDPQGRFMVEALAPAWLHALVSSLETKS